MKKETNSCYTYFRIAGNFDPDRISEMLGLRPDKQWKIGDLRRNGTAYDCALWTHGTCTSYDVITNNQLLITLEDFFPRIHTLQEIKREYDVSFFLTIVPTISTEESTPVLSPSLDVMRFCCETETEIDLDLYVYSSDDSK